MKLKTRLLTAFCIIIFVPVALAGATLWGVNHLQLREIQKTYGFEGTSNYYMANTIQILSQITASEYSDLEEIAETSPIQLETASSLKELNDNLMTKYSYLIVRVGDELTFLGSNQTEQIPEKLEPYGTDENSESTSTATMYVDDATQQLIKQIDFTTVDGEEASAFIVTCGDEVMPQMKTLFADFFIAIILILLLTAAILVLWIYQGMINPIRKLQLAAKNIKEGNLDFKIEAERQDELGELTQNFEEMRQRLKISAEEKVNAENENRVLISNICHDLKTPITAVKGYVEGIIDGVADTPEKQDKYIRTIYNKANEMNMLINELTLYSNIDTNRIPYNFKKISVSDYFSDCIEELGMDLESKDVGLAYFNYVDEKSQIIADPEQLKRVINNIVGNSVKYLDPNKQKGFVNIRIKDVGDFIQVEIEDNGKGISAKDLPFIFDRFFRADESRNSATGGSGIGLSIVKKIIEDHGGKIWATSKEATGTIMYFVIRKYQEVPNE